MVASHCRPSSWLKSTTHSVHAVHASPQKEKTRTRATPRSKLKKIKQAIHKKDKYTFLPVPAQVLQDLSLLCRHGHVGRIAQGVIGQGFLPLLPGGILRHLR